MPDMDTARSEHLPQGPVVDADWLADHLDDVVVVDFTSEVAGWSPEQFVDTVLRPLHPRRVVVGENFRFGFRAAGDPALLASLGAGEFVVDAVPLFSDGAQASSSTLIRHALDDARDRRLTVVPECEFVAAFIDDHPEYRDLVG